MKYILSFLLGSVFWSASPVASQAQGTIDDKYAKQRSTFESHDHNKDGLVADFEYIQDMKDRFAARDANKNGTLSRKENFRSLYAQYKESVKDLDEKDHLPPSVLIVEYEALFDLEDTNGDDIVTEYENLHSYRNLFKKIDANKDNFVDWNEYISFLESEEYRLLLKSTKIKNP